MIHCLRRATSISVYRQRSSFISSSVTRVTSRMSSNAQLPVLTPQERRRWDKMSINMSYFHEMFKQEFNTLYQLADGSFTQRGMSLSSFLNIARSLCHHLTLHHTIEERHIFPVLATRMSAFKEEHIESHKGIHEGVAKLSALVSKYTDQPSSYSPTELRKTLDDFREVLFKHMDDEVEDLKGDKLRQHFSLAEIDGLM